MQTAIQLAHGFAGTETTGEKFGLTLGDRALNARRHLHRTALKIAVDQLERIEPPTDQHRAWQRMRQRPVLNEFGTADGKVG
ncbi:hypothetical protein PSE10B_40160 [Pseudomonas amygdali pv. eriobotryae]|nr:hypothetical protein PSE10B_40160 [Pseudomonas amygdali pv. eriobotryae]